jgi:hypothetical protein
MAVPNIRQLVNIMLGTTSFNYTIWCDLMLMALTQYSLANHVLSDDAFIDVPVWTSMDAIILCWLTNMITADLQEVIQECGHSGRHLWFTLENQFLRNRETHTLHLDATFRNFVQGDLSMIEYCRKFEGMADALADLRSPVDDWILILNIHHGLNQYFENLVAIIRRSSSFLNFLKVYDDHLLEEIHLDTTGPSAAPTVLYTSTAPPTPKPQPFAPSRPTNSKNNRNKNNNRCNGGNDGKNNNSGGGCGGNFGNTVGTLRTRYPPHTSFMSRQHLPPPG